MMKNTSKKPKDNGKYHIIYGLHAVKAALLNDKRDHEELFITENYRKLAEKYQTNIKKITWVK